MLVHILLLSTGALLSKALQVVQKWEIDDKHDKVNDSSVDELFPKLPFDVKVPTLPFSAPQEDHKDDEVGGEEVTVVAAANRLDQTLIDHSKKQPHILFMLIDDLGWADVSFNREDQLGVQTFHIDRLREAGIKLDRHYVHKTCSPTRSAIQTGRAPIHVNVLNLANGKHNPDDDVSGFPGIPRNMTGIAEVLRKAGYATHMVGKWDAGMTTPEHTPAGRGYDTSLAYFSHDNDCWTAEATESGCWTPEKTYPFMDLWEHDENISYPGRPALDFLNSKSCSFTNQQAGGAKCVYEDQVFEERVKGIIRNHKNAYRHENKPFFIFWSTRGVHGDYQPPGGEEAKLNNEIQSFSALTPQLRAIQKYYDLRKNYFAMVTWLDGAIGRVVRVLHKKNMYKNTLIVFTSDNGAQPGGNNYPLRGSKWSNWEGGIRSAAFVSGGFLPAAVRNTTTNGLVAVWDWYATFAHLAGADPKDKKAKKAGLPEVDSINVWPLISGAKKHSLRKAISIGGSVNDNDIDGEAQTQVSGLIRLHSDGNLYKILIGDGPGKTLRCSAWGNPRTIDAYFSTSMYPIAEFCNVTTVCGTTPDTACLFNLDADPGERTNLAKKMPELLKDMMEDLSKRNQSVFSPNRGKIDYNSCFVGIERYGSFWGPYYMLPPNSSTH